MNLEEKYSDHTIGQAAVYFEIRTEYFDEFSQTEWHLLDEVMKGKTMANQIVALKKLGLFQTQYLFKHRSLFHKMKRNGQWRLVGNHHNFKPSDGPYCMNLETRLERTDFAQVIDQKYGIVDDNTYNDPAVNHMDQFGKCIPQNPKTP